MAYFLPWSAHSDHQEVYCTFFRFVDPKKPSICHDCVLRGVTRIPKLVVTTVDGRNPANHLGWIKPYKYWDDHVHQQYVVLSLYCNSWMFTSFYEINLLYTYVFHMFFVVPSQRMGQQKTQMVPQGRQKKRPPTARCECWNNVAERRWSCKTNSGDLTHGKTKHGVPYFPCQILAV